MNKILEKYSNLSITSLVLLAIALLILFGFKAIGLSSDAFLSLISAIIGGLIASSSQTWISAQDRKNQLRLAAVDKRLEVHQQAYTLWRKLLANINNEKVLTETVLECQDWWGKNCLYLDEKARQAFVRAYLSAGSHRVMILSKDAELVKQSLQAITDAGAAIVAGVSFPTIGQNETKFFEENKKK